MDGRTTYCGTTALLERSIARQKRSETYWLQTVIHITPVKPSGAKMATENTAMARLGLLYGRRYEDLFVSRLSLS